MRLLNTFKNHALIFLKFARLGYRQKRTSGSRNGVPHLNLNNFDHLFKKIKIKKSYLLDVF